MYLIKRGVLTNLTRIISKNMRFLNKGILASVLMSTVLSVSAADIKATASNPALMVIDGDTITKGEFEYMYHKNNSSALNGPVSVDEYMNLFIGYKRKAIDAVNQMYNVRSAAYTKEFNDYMKQVVSPYLMDKATEEEFVKEAYDRLKESRACSHILIKVGMRSNEQQAKGKIDVIYNKLLNGASFAELAKEYSECGSAERGGYLDYFTAFEMVYDFENVAYNTEVGHFSKPFRTQFGWHILLVHDVKKNYTKAHVKEIFLSPMNEDNRVKADSLKALIDKGAKFEKLAKKYSCKKDAKVNKGDQGWISSENAVPEYLSEVFKIQHNNQTVVFPSPLGFHIVKMIEGVTTPPLDSASYENIKKHLSRSDRYDAVMKKNKKELALKHGYVLHEDVVEALGGLLWTPVYEVEDSLMKYDTPVYEFDGVAMTPTAFASEFKEIQNAYHKKLSGQMVTRLGMVVDTSASFAVNLKNEIDRMVERDAEKLEIADVKKNNIEVAYQLQEYSDGLLVYGISKETIWDKGVNQPDSLEAFFQKHRSDYQFKEDRFVGYIYCFADSMDMVKAKSYVESNKIEPVNSKEELWKKFNFKSKHCTYRDGAWAKGKSKLCDRYVYSDTTAHPSEVEKYPYVFVCGEISKRPMKAAQVRGQVLADYQKGYEKAYNEYLEKKYPVTLFTEVVEQIKKENK